jgi:Domain of unknown function (DUF5916)
MPICFPPALVGALLCVPPSDGPAAVYVGRENQIHISVPRAAAAVVPPLIDGVIDDTAWRDAALLTGFSQFSPQDGIPAADSTQVLVFYTPTDLYIAVRAYESHAAVHATLADRDKIAADDNVQILLGTFHDKRQAFVFGVNPFGIQMDGTLVEAGQSLSGGWTPTLIGRAAADLSQDYVFASKGRLTDYGFEVELRIPFKSLKYQGANEQSWDFNVIRRVQHSGFEDSWAPAKRANASFLGQSGTLDGLRNMDRGLVLDVNPVVTQKSTGAPGAEGWSYARGRTQAGGSVRWGVNNNLTLNGTARPDFAEVESDAGQFIIDPRQALFFAEKRPFFLDGLEQFSVPHQLVYTRRIAEPVAAVKLTGKIAGTNVGVLSAVDDPSLSPSGNDETYYNVLRAQRDIGGQSRLGLAYTDRVVASNYNRVADMDGRVVFGKVYSSSVQYARSYTSQNARVTSAPLWEGILARNGKRFGLRYVVTGIDEEFRASSGFISRPGIVHAGADHRGTWFGERGRVVESLTGDVLVDGTWQYSHFVRRGDAQDKKFHLSTSAGVRGGWTLGAGAYWETFGFDDRLYAGYQIVSANRSVVDTVAFTGVPRIFNRDYVATVATPQFAGFSGSMLYVWGQDENFFEWAQADVQFLSLALNFRPSDQLRVAANIDYNDYVRRSDGSLVGRNAIPRLKIEYQLTQSIFIRAVGEYTLSEHDDLRDETRTNFPLIIDGSRALATRDASFHGDYLFSYRPNPGTVFFVGYGSRADAPANPLERFKYQPLIRSSDYLFVKFSYLVRL